MPKHSVTAAVQAALRTALTPLVTKSSLDAAVRTATGEYRTAGSQPQAVSAALASDAVTLTAKGRTALQAAGQTTPTPAPATPSPRQSAAVVDQLAAVQAAHTAWVAAGRKGVDPSLSMPVPSTRTRKPAASTPRATYAALTADDMAAGHAVCRGECGRDLPVTKFPTITGPDHRGGECRECRDARAHARGASWGKPMPTAQPATPAPAKAARKRTGKAAQPATPDQPAAAPAAKATRTRKASRQAA